MASRFCGFPRHLIPLLAACAVLPASSLATIGGHNADGNVAISRSTVAVVIEDRSKPGPDGRPGYYPSTGIVVAPDWILTVKHAFAEHDGPQYVWQVHPTDEIRKRPEAPVQTIGRSQVTFHPDLDLALVHLDRPLPFEYRPARLVTDGRRLAAGPVLTAILAGYGSDARSGRENRLRMAEAPVSAVSILRGRRWPDLVPPDQGNNYLEVDQRAGRGSCAGDSGGPVFARLNGGAIGVLGVIRGNASYDGSHPCIGYSYAVRVDRAMAWIAQATGRIYDPVSMLLVDADPVSLRR